MVRNSLSGFKGERVGEIGLPLQMQGTLRVPRVLERCVEDAGGHGSGYR